VNLDSIFRFNKKVESLNHEYNTILLTTLDNQRTYFEDEIQKIYKKRDEALDEKKEELNSIISET
jgi:hypothetical protein